MDAILLRGEYYRSGWQRIRLYDRQQRLRQSIRRRWKPFRISRDGTMQVVTDLHEQNDGMWFGIDLWGGSERCEDVAVWRLKLKDNVFQYEPEYSIDRIWDGDGSTTQPGIAYSTLDWTNVTGLSFAFNFGYAQGKNTFGNIYGVKSDGTRVLIFEGSKAISRGITYMDAAHIPEGGSNPVLNANDFTYVAYSKEGVDALSGVNDCGQPYGRRHARYCFR